MAGEEKYQLPSADECNVWNNNTIAEQLACDIIVKVEEDGHDSNGNVSTTRDSKDGADLDDTQIVCCGDLNDSVEEFASCNEEEPDPTTAAVNVMDVDGSETIRDEHPTSGLCPKEASGEDSGNQLQMNETVGEEAKIDIEKPSNQKLEESAKVVPDSQKSDDNAEKDADEDGVDCGFLVDKITCAPYQKAIERGEVPFCAFAPISTKDLYLLRIQDCSDTTRHMLVPASKEEVFNTPGALKIMEEDDDKEPVNEESASLNYRVPIVAIARQIYCEEDRQLVVSVDPLLKKDKKGISSVKFLTVDKFADFAFLGFDGNISEYASKNEAATIKENRRSSSNQLSKSEEKKPNVAPPLPGKIKSPPKAPTRRGRGGRRRGTSRKSPARHSSHPQPSQCHIFQVHPGASTSQIYPGNFQPLPPGSFIQNTDPTFALLNVSQVGGTNQHQQFVAHQVPPFPPFQHSVQVGFVQDPFSMPMQMPPMMHTEYSVPVPMPMPMSEIAMRPPIESLAQPLTQPSSHDILTIAFDQLANMGGDPFAVTSGQAPNRNGSSSARGGRRPGRKPGRKPFKEKNQRDMDEAAASGQLLGSNEAGIVIPKRRGRPPKVRPPPPPPKAIIPMPGQENENSNSNMDGEGLDSFEKRPKLNEL